MNENLSRIPSFALRCACVAGLLLSALSLSANEETEVYKRLYYQTATQTQKFAIISALVDMDDPGMGEMMGAILIDLSLKDRKQLVPIEADAWDKSVRLACAAVGKFKATESADVVYGIAQSHPDALVRAEALIALGRMRANEYAERVSVILSDLNASAPSGKENGEKIAWGAIGCLGKMGDKIGWMPVFYASQGWYSGATKRAAAESLEAMLQDPTEPVLKVLDIDSVALKVLALQYETKSPAPKTSKAQAARLALEKGISQIGKDQVERNALAQLRTYALNLLCDGADNAPSTVALIRAMWPTSTLDEKLIAFKALGINASDEAAVFLSELLDDYNQRRERDIVSTEGDRITKAALINAGATKNRKLLPVLLAMKNNNKWAGGISLAISDAMKAIQGK